VHQLEDQLIKRTNSIFGKAVAFRGDEDRECQTELGNDGGVLNLLRGREGLIKSCWRVYVVCERSDDCHVVLRQEVRARYRVHVGRPGCVP
jgi:hypothetical protein